MKCLVTGGSGFIGSHIYELIKQNHQITVLDKIFTKNLKNKKIKFVRNLSNEKQLKRHLKIRCCFSFWRFEWNK